MMTLRGFAAEKAAFAILIFFIIYLRYRYSQRFQSRSRGYPLPPRPKGAFLLGNIFHLIARKPWLMFADMKGRYGDIIYFEALGNRVIVLNSLEVAHDLLETRAHIYSDRPSFTMIGELIGLGKSLPMLPYGPEFRKQRKLCHHGLSPAAVKAYRTIQEAGVRSYVRSVLSHPESFISELRLSAGRIILSVTYGFPVDMEDNTYLEDAEATMKMIEKGTTLGAYYVDMIPLLKHMPAWMPFNTIPAVASSGRKLLFRMVDKPYQHVKNALAAGSSFPSFTAECLMQSQGSNGELSEADEDSLRWAAGSMYGAGGESTFATVLTFIYAMALYPEVQTKIQAEIDRVIGNERLPTIDDKNYLPYVRSVIKETMRWRPALPMAIPRATSQDDYYNGYFIPAGTIVLPNVWSMSVDDVSGIPPMDFIPERFMESSDTPGRKLVDPSSYSFGFGRRLCPGKALGENNIFLFITYLMCTVNIFRKRDAEGNCIPLESQYTDGLVSFPTPFAVDFSPRDQNRVSLLERT
ncbi:cytochrome P450 [Agrocybe pediades]|nr:cytochrome P450 [Agrocybe pediades]